MKIAIIVGSTRQGRATPKVAKWVEKTAKNIKLDAEFDVIDIHDFALPMFDESMAPQGQQNREPTGNLKKWLDRLADADGYIFVTPEYNHSVPGSLKSAIDYIDFQLKRKPAAIVSHGVNGGARANEHLRLILNSNLGAVLVPESVTLSGMVAYADIISDDHELHEDYKNAQSPLENLLSSIVWHTSALKIAREA